MIEKLDKKSLQCLGIIIIIAIVVCIGLFYYLKWTELKEAPEQEKPLESKKEETIKQQLQELEEEAGSLSEEEIKKQLEELEQPR